MKSSVSTVLTLLVSTVLAAAAAGQAGGFTPGDVWQSNDALAVAFPGAALTRIDPLSDVVTPEHASPAQNGFGCLAFDTYRHRLLWRATADGATHTWQVDGAGHLTDMGLPPTSFGWFAPAGDGRVFCIENTGGPKFVDWIDAANRVHRVLDAAGLVTYQLPQGPFLSTRGMVYDAATNALYAGSSLDCDGLSHQQAVIGRLDLSADGTRVLGPPTCVSYDITSAFLEFVTELSHLPDGRILVTCVAPDQTPYVPEARLLVLDPGAMTLTPFALLGIAGQPFGIATNDGVWSSALNAALVLDTFNDNLRVFAAGSNGDGAVITPTSPGVSSGGGSSEAQQIAEISPTACDGAWVPYSVGLAGKGSFVPALIGGGCPMPGAAITLQLSDVVGAATGTLFVGLAPAALPFKGGKLAVGAISLTLPIAVSGAPGVAGAGTLSLPAVLPAGSGFSGVSIYLQGAFSDAAAVNKVSLTQGLQLEIG